MFEKKIKTARILKINLGFRVGYFRTNHASTLNACKINKNIKATRYINDSNSKKLAKSEPIIKTWITIKIPARYMKRCRIFQYLPIFFTA